MARIAVQADRDLAAIAAAAGQDDPGRRRYEAGELIVEGVEQAALEAAAAGAQPMDRRLAKVLAARRQAYREALGPDEIEGLGRALRVLVVELDRRGAAETAAFTELAATVAAVEASHPDPE